MESGIPAIKKEKAYLRIVDVVMDLNPGSGGV